MVRTIWIAPMRIAPTLHHIVMKSSALYLVNDIIFVTRCHHPSLGGKTGCVLDNWRVSSQKIWIYAQWPSVRSLCLVPDVQLIIDFKGQLKPFDHLRQRWTNVASDVGQQSVGDLCHAQFHFLIIRLSRVVCWSWTPAVYTCPPNCIVQTYSQYIFLEKILLF